MPTARSAPPTAAARGHKLGWHKKLFNRHHATVRAVGEQGASTFKRWHILRHARCSPARLTAFVQAILALHHHAS
ncbi:transposase family protein [Spirillospora sp. NBC_01491]|uniref:transposase family protein n=1 Tax=Spirillospora sp. NBC_01491 TaxID=2976007 RepID=UPI002E36F1B6|nr:transposase family protein [Spirillospora sp. NBC_01491]